MDKHYSARGVSFAKGGSCFVSGCSDAAAVCAAGQGR